MTFGEEVELFLNDIDGLLERVHTFNDNRVALGLHVILEGTEDILEDIESFQSEFILCLEEGVVFFGKIIPVLIEVTKEFIHVVNFR